MATESTGLIRSYAAYSDLSAQQFFLMKHYTTAGQVTRVTGITDVPIGLLQNKPSATGRTADVMSVGWSKASIATSAIAIADKLGPHTTGQLIKKTVADNAQVCAIAEAAATTTGDIITVMLFPTRWVHVS